MKKKVIGIISLVLAGTMVTVFLTGCGTEAKATDQEVPMEEETIVVSEAGMETVEEEETTIEKEIGTDSEGDIVFYDKIGEYPDYLLSDLTYETIEEKAVTAVDDIAVYSEEGIKVGHVKSGVTVTLTEHGINSRWYRFGNPVKGTDYQYLCMFEDDIPIDESELLTLEEVKDRIIADISNRMGESPKFLEEPEENMEYVEFSIDRQEEYGQAEWMISQNLHSNDEFIVIYYGTFYVECTENEDMIICKVYYKDLIE